jgi:hypothetical protein
MVNSPGPMPNLSSLFLVLNVHAVGTQRVQTCMYSVLRGKHSDRAFADLHMGAFSLMNASIQV